jgi:hypothetical protein
MNSAMEVDIAMACANGFSDNIPIFIPWIAKM